MRRKEINSPVSRTGFLALLCIMALLAPLFLSLAPSAKAGPSQQISLDQNWGYYDTTLHIHGSNFSPNSNIIVTWSSLSYWSLLTKSDATGSFDLFFNPPTGVTAGNYLISACDQMGNNFSTPFTLRSIYSTTGSFGIRTSSQFVQWIYGNNGFYLDLWQFYNTAYGGWYSLLNHNYGTYITRFTYNGSTYVFDLAGGKFNSFPNTLSERVIGFAIMDVNRIEGLIQVYDSTGTTLLFTVTVDIYVPPTPANYYVVTFTITAATKLNNFAFYAEQNLDIWTTTPNWATYDNQNDVVYQYYGPDGSNLQIPQQYSAYAGFGSTLLASTHHDAALDYADIQNVATNLIVNNFNYKDRNQANGESIGNPGIGLEWTLGTLNPNTPQTIIPISYAESDNTVNQFNANIAQGKMFAYQIQSKTPFITLGSTQGPGSAIIQISGQNFMPNAQIKINFAGIPMSNFLTDGTGSFQGNFVVPTSVTGTYSVTATDQYSLTASTPFTVVELTLNWLLNNLNQFDASITSLLTDPNGNLCTLIKTNDGNIIAKLSDLQANVNQLVTNSNGQVQAEINTAVGTITANLNQINATIVGVVTNSNGQVQAEINTAVGTITANLNQMNANIVGVVTNSNGQIQAQINTAVGTITANLNQINANIVGVVTNSNGQIQAQINTAVGTITANLNQINATIVGVVKDANNSLSVKIDTEIGTITAKLDQINASVTDVVTSSNGTLCALINTSIGSVLTKLSDVNANLTQLITNSNGQVLAEIDTAAGIVTANLNQINATIVGIVRDTSNSLNAKIDTNLGTTLARLDTLNATLIAVNGSIATINTEVGTIKTNLTSINAQITLSNGNLATIQTDVGIIKGNVTSIGNGTIAIETKLGIIKTATSLNNMNVPLQAVVLVEIVAISGSFLTILMLRKGLPKTIYDLKHYAKTLLHRTSLSKKPNQ